MMKQLAAEADARWKAIPSYLDSPNKQQPQPAIGVKDPGGYVQQTEPEQKEGVRSAVDDANKVQAATEGRAEDEGRFKGTAKEKKAKENPWSHLQPKGNAGENWQPEAWSPAPTQRGR
jgi:NADH dehydrogenase [ubiquinone] 1 alpha subcomplex assembly factor 2